MDEKVGEDYAQRMEGDGNGRREPYCLQLVGAVFPLERHDEQAGRDNGEFKVCDSLHPFIVHEARKLACRPHPDHDEEDQDVLPDGQETLKERR